MATDGKKLNQLPELTTLSDATMLYAVDGGEDYHVNFETIKDGAVPEVFTPTTDGLVPHPNSGNGGKVLRGDGTWQGTFDSLNDGLVPKLGTNDKDNVLRGDGAWVTNDKLIGTGSGSLVTFDAIEAPMPSLKASIKAKQDLHGYDKPWVGGAGKNKLPMTISAIKAANTSGTWTGNVYAVDNGSIEILTDAANNVTGLKVNGSFAGVFTFILSSSYATLSDMFGDGNYYLSQGVALSLSTQSGVMLQRQEAGSNIYINNNATEVAFTSTRDSNHYRPILRFYSGDVVNNIILLPMVRVSTESDTFAPYSNECPISGWDNAIVTDTDDVDNPTVTQTTTISLGQTVYGGEVDVVNGELKITDGYIASYNGETLPSTWISSMDVYAEGTTPTTGAEVCYELATPTTVSITPSLIKSLNGTNNLSVDCGEILEVEYQRSITEAINVLEAGGGYSETSLWSNSSGVYTGSLALSDSIENYNALMFKVSNAQGWANFAFIPTSALASNNAKAGIGGGMQSAVWWFQFTRTDATHITINNNSSTGDKLYQIVGVKY